MTDDPLADERAKRLAELEARVSKPSGVGVLPPMAALGLVAALAGMAMQRDEFSYFFSEKQAIELGREGEYRFERAESNRYAQVHGTPTVTGAYWLQGERAMVAVGVLNAPLAVIRTTLPSEDWHVGKTGPQPDQRPFSVKGRLLSAADAVKPHRAALDEIRRRGEVDPKWVLVAEERPGGSVSASLWLGALISFALLNLWLLIRGLTAHQRQPSSPET